MFHSLALALGVLKLLWPFICPGPFTPQHTLIAIAICPSFGPPPCGRLCCQQSWCPTLTSKPVDLAVGVSEESVPPSAPCVLKRAHLHEVLPTRFRASAHTVAPLPLRPPPPRHKLVPRQRGSLCAAAPCTVVVPTCRMQMWLGSVTASRIFPTLNVTSHLKTFFCYRKKFIAHPAAALLATRR